MICVCVPESVRVPVPLAPELIVAPPPRVTVIVPLATLSLVVDRLLSPSLTLTPAIAKEVFLTTVWADGITLMGASTTELTVIATVLEFVNAVASVDRTVSVSEPLKLALPW